MAMLMTPNVSDQRRGKLALDLRPKSSDGLACPSESPLLGGWDECPFARSSATSITDPDSHELAD